MDDLLQIKNKYGSYISYYEEKELISLIRLKENQPIKIREFKITSIHVKSIENSTIFVIENINKKIIYAPCNVKPFPVNNIKIQNANILIIGNVFHDEPLKDNYLIPVNNPLRDNASSLQEIFKIKKQVNIDKIVITHIEEEWGKSFDDYIKIEKKYKKENIKFAYDGMQINL